MKKKKLFKIICTILSILMVFNSSVTTSLATESNFRIVNIEAEDITEKTSEIVSSEYETMENCESSEELVSELISSEEQILENESNEETSLIDQVTEDEYEFSEETINEETSALDQITEDESGDEITTEDELTEEEKQTSDEITTEDELTEEEEQTGEELSVQDESFVSLTANNIVISNEIVERTINAGKSLIGSRDYDGYCQKFVWKCFNDGGFPNNSSVSFASAKICGDTLLISTTKQAPRGSVVFFDSSDHSYGHIGISLGDGTMLHAGHKGVEITAFTDDTYLKNWYHIYYRGWGIWGSTKGNSLEDSNNIISFNTYGTEGSRGSLSETNAVLYTVINTTKTSGLKCGLRIDTASGNLSLASKEEDMSSAGYNQISNNGYVEVWYNLNTELNCYLEPGRTYYYQFYMKWNGTEYADEIRSFTTPGTDTQQPTISNVTVTDLTKDGYTVTCTVNDNVGVTSVKFPTWIEGTTNAVWYDGTINGNTATFRVLASNFSNESVTLRTDIYAYDAAGNSVSYKNIPPQIVDRNAPTIKDVKITDLNKDGYTVTCTVNDNVGVTSVKFPTWIEGTTNAVWHDGTINKNTATFRILASNFSNESVTLQTHIYAYDAAGNSASYKNIPTQVVDRNAPTIKDVKITDLNKDGYTVTCTVNDNVGVTSVKFPTWIEGTTNAVWNDGTINGNTATFRILASDFSNESVTLQTHIYAYDAAGNSVSYENIPPQVVNRNTESDSEPDLDNQLINLSSATLTCANTCLKVKKNNAAQVPKNIKVVYNGKTLKKNTDYTISYKKDGTTVTKPTTVGEYTMIVTGIGKYTGTKSITITVTNKKLLSSVTVKVNKMTYTGQPIISGVIKNVKSGKTNLIEGIDYIVTYENNVNSGKGAIILKAVEDSEYAGEKRISFDITGIKMSKVKVIGIEAVYFNGKGNVTQDLSKIKLVHNNNILIMGTNYDVSYEKNDKAGTARIVFTGKGIYNGTLKKNFKIKKVNLINVQMDNSNITVPLEKGGAKPDVNLTYNGVKLIKGVDYTLSYTNNKSANGKKTPAIKIKGKGSYTGTLTKTFTIIESY